MAALKRSSSLDYALKALVDMALHQGIGPVTVKSIAKRQEIPVRYLEQLFNRLRRRGIVAAERGPRGGYRLGRPAAEISVNEIFESLEQEPAGASAKTRKRVDPAASLWKQVESAVQTTLEATTLQSLIDQVGESVLSDVKHPFTFHI